MLLAEVLIDYFEALPKAGCRGILNPFPVPPHRQSELSQLSHLVRENIKALEVSESSWLESEDAFEESEELKPATRESHSAIDLEEIRILDCLFELKVRLNLLR